MISRVGIRGRGAHSSDWRQKPYSVEAMDEAGGERDVSPLGLPAHADWILSYPDADGLPDAWETAHGLDPVDPGDAGLDPDSDGAAHVAELIAGTDPAEARGVLALEIIRSGTGTGLQLRFHALPLRSHALEACDELPPRRWNRVAEFPAEPTARIQTVPLSASPNVRCFRLVTPRPPR